MLLWFVTNVKSRGTAFAIRFDKKANESNSSAAFQTRETARVNEPFVDP